MADDPITDLVNEWPTPAVIRTIDATAADYDPREEDTVGGASTTPVVGFFSNAVEDGADYHATLILKAVDKPSHLKAQASRCVCAGDDYAVSKVHTRFWEGKINGYALELSL